MTTARTTRDKTSTPTPTSIAFTSKKELNKVRAAARRAGKSVSRFLRELALEAVARQCPRCGAAKHSAAA